MESYQPHRHPEPDITYTLTFPNGHTSTFDTLQALRLHVIPTPMVGEADSLPEPVANRLHVAHLEAVVSQAIDELRALGRPELVAV